MTWQGSVILLVMILGAGFYAGVETGAYCLSRLRLTVLVRHADRRARQASRLLKDPAGVIAMTLVGHNLCVFAATVLLTNAFARTHHAELYATLILSPVLFVFAETTPKHLFARRADRLFYRAVAFIWLSKILFYPAIFLLRWVSRFWQGVLGGAPEHAQDFLMTPAQLEFLFAERQKTGQLSAYQKTLAVNIMRLSRLRVERAMVPMDKVIAFEATDAVSTVLDAARDHPFTRYPVYKDEQLNVIGVINVVDLGLAPPESEDLVPLVKETVSVASTRSVLDVLHEMRSQYAMMAIVIHDGAPAGIVTVKDLIEEIAGELAEW